MKIYHTETQADYDALMEELEEQGCKWLSERKPTEAKYHWFNYEEKTCVRVSFGILTKFEFRHSKEEYPDVPIIKYKAKADEKMKFTKENVEKVIDDYFREADFEPCGDLIAEIHNLDDTPEKVVVPKFVADWIEWNEVNGVSLRNMLRCYKHFCENTDPIVSDGEKAVQWYVDNPYKFIQAYEDGYTIEPEQLYYIPLPHLKTTDGIQQVLTKRSKNDRHYFASRPNESLKQRYTKEELAQVPEIYKFYAKPIEEEK